VDPFPVEMSGDPLGGHPIDRQLRWAWSKRRADRHVTHAFPIPEVDDPAPVARSPVSERMLGWRQRYLPLPDEVVHTYLGRGEDVLHSDHPAFRSFLVDRILVVVALILGGALVVMSLDRGWTLVAQIVLAAMALMLVVLVYQRLADRYTSYVITNVRMIRMSGIVSRSIESIPWIRVTDLGFDQSLLERLLGYATLHIESANETMGLREMRGIADPVTFNQYLMDMVVAKQGPAAPLGRRSEYTVLPAHRGLFGRRKEAEHGPLHRRVLDDTSPDAGIDPDDPTVMRPATESGPATGGEAIVIESDAPLAPGDRVVEVEVDDPNQSDI
jgi:membrane protein YdbS with pleckstrin-like domain